MLTIIHLNTLNIFYDFRGGRSYNQTIDKDIAENIQLILKTNSCVHPYDKLRINNNGRIVCKICNKKLS